MGQSNWTDNTREVILDIVSWVESVLGPRTCTSDELVYDHMVSQSDRCLPLIYKPFDMTKRSHWADRGSAFDYLASVGDGRLLDFGPGDGWPSLIVAPYVREVVGVDSSARRVAVCAENAARMHITNASFVHVPAGGRLPFENSTFDGIMAASSVEQTPSPKATLAELYRVLRPGGKLRIHYEALGQYRDGRERELSLWGRDKNECHMHLYDRDIDAETVRWYSLVFAMSASEIAAEFGCDGSALSIDSLSEEGFQFVLPSLTDARACTLHHPSGATYSRYLNEVGFGKVLPTCSGAALAARMFNETPADERPRSMRALDKLLRPLVEREVCKSLPIETDPMITAIK